MDSKSLEKMSTRREMLRMAGMFAGAAALPRFVFASPAWFGAGGTRDAFADAWESLQEAQATGDRVATFRAQSAANPVQKQKLTENMTMLSGCGGNIVLLDGKDGKVLVDTFVAPAWPKLKEALGGPAKFVINTHWHFDHADNNAALHAEGATVIAHENTKTRLSAAQHIPILELDFPPSPAEALPQRTFKTTSKLDANGEHISMTHVDPAHTDTDIYIYFEKANVVHMGDLYFSAGYPFIDAGTGGKLDGMIAAAGKALAVADKDTKIVPGHGPLANKEGLTKYRDMMVTARDRVEKLKSAGKPVEEAIAAKPLADLDAEWGKGMLNGDMFVRVAYLTI